MGETSKSRPEINMLLCRMVLAWTGARARAATRAGPAETIA